MAKKQGTASTKSPLDCVKRERDELQARLSKLCAFTGDGKHPSGEFLTLSPANRIFLERQCAVMKEYRDILDCRIELMEAAQAK